MLELALAADVRRFGYVSVYGGRVVGALEYITAHESFAFALRTSGADYVVIRPTALFASFEPLLHSARKGKLTVVAGGTARTNPIHQEELAIACVDALEGHEQRRLEQQPHRREAPVRAEHGVLKKF